jgi:putative flippase GtrA
LGLIANTLTQFMRFSAVGLLNTGIGFSAIMLAMLLGASPTLANVIGYATGLPVSFVLNKAWTFADKRRSSPQIPRFIAVFVIAYGANILTLQVLTHALQINPYLAQFFSICVYSGTFFAGCKWAIFVPDKTGENLLVPPPDSR